MRIKIPDFVTSELEYFRAACNFTPEQLEFFNLSASGKSLTEIQLAMCISESKCNRLSKSVKTKIYKVI